MRIICAHPALLGCLLIRIGPVEDLVFDELARVEGTERCAREVEVEARLDGEPGLVERVACTRYRRVIGIVYALVIFGGEQAPCGVAPCTEVVFVEDHKVPCFVMHPLIAGLDASRLLVYAEVVLKRAKTYDRSRGVAILIEAHITCDELPALEIDMGLKVFLPRGFDCGLEGEHEYALHVHVTGELVGSKCLAKAHLRVPEKLGCAVLAGRLATAEVCLGLLDGGALLGAHGEALSATTLVVLTVAHLEPGIAYIIDGAAKPLTALVDDAVREKALMDVVIHEGGAIVSHSRFGEDDFIRLSLAGLDHGELLRHAAFDVMLREANLEEAPMFGEDVLVSVDLRMDIRSLGEEAADCHRITPLAFLESG